MLKVSTLVKFAHTSDFFEISLRINFNRTSLFWQKTARLIERTASHRQGLRLLFF